MRFFLQNQQLKYSPLQKISKMSSVNKNCNGSDIDFVNDIDNVNYDVFAVGNFSHPFYSAFKKLTQL